MSYFEKYHKFTSLIKLIFLVVFSTLLSGCIYGTANVQVKLNNNKQSLLNINVANVQVINHQFIITGTGLSAVTAFKIKNGSSTTDLQIESKSNTSIVANTLSNVSFAVGTIFDFVLSNANAASTFQVTFANSNNSVTAAMLTSMGATTGQVMKYNGTNWVASSLTNAQTYLGTWNSATNTPDLTLPSSMPGDYYIVSVAGTFNSVSYAVGDWIISDGYNWQKVANSAVVVSTFNGRRGIVTLLPADYVSLKNGAGKLPGSSLNDLDDLNIVTPANGSVLKYDTATSKWIVGVDNSGAGTYSGTASKAVATDGAGALTTSTTTAAELGYVAGVTSSIQTQLGTKLGTSLASTNIFVGNGSAVATAVAMSGDATLSNAGLLTLKNTGTAGTYTSVTTDAQGRVTSGTNPAVAAITALTGDVTATGTGSVAATIAANAVTTGKINDGTILPADLDFTGTNIGTSGLVIRNLTGGFTPLVCSTVGFVPTWTVTGFICQASTAGSLSSLTAAATTNTIDNSNFSQIWNWATATTQSLMTFASNALTTGTILNLSTSNGSVNSTNGLLNVANTGASTSGTLARFQANSTAGSGMTMLTNGNVGVGTTTPGTSLEVAGQIKITGGSPGAGKILTSDAAGLATWVSPSSVTSTAITITSVSYGNAGQINSCGTYVQTTCDGMATCTYTANNTNCGSDPATGLIKSITVAYSCGSTSTTKTSNEDVPTTISCVNNFIAGGNTFGFAANLGTTDNFDLSFMTNNQVRATISASGNFGIGQATPLAKLDIQETTAGSAAFLAESSGTNFFKVLNPAGGITNSYNAANSVLYVGSDTGTGRSINASGTISSGGADFAEWVDWPSETQPEMGSIVSYKGSHVVVSSPFTAAFIGNDTKDSSHSILVAFMGQLPVLVRGVVHEGDLIIANGDGTGSAVSRDLVSLAMAKNAVGTAWASSSDKGLKRVNVAVGIGLGGNGARDIASIKAENAQLKADSAKLRKDYAARTRELDAVKARLEKIEKALNLK